MKDDSANGWDLTREVRAATTKEKARVIVETEAQRYLARTPWVPIEVWIETALDHIGFLTGYLERPEANRILDLFETEHPWRDREGNELPSKRKRGQSRRARSFAVLIPLMEACKTKEEAHALVEEEVANLVADDPKLAEKQCRKIMLDIVRFQIRYAKAPEIAARLAKLFGVTGTEVEQKKSA
jgi:hypothetical protein